MDPAAVPADPANVVRIEIEGPGAWIEHAVEAAPAANPERIRGRA